MAGNPESGRRRIESRWRMAAWCSAAAVVLLPPLVAMQLTHEVNWTVADFVFAGALVGGAGLTYELAARMTRNTAYRAAVGVALAAAFMLVWVNGAVGIIGSEDNLANLMYGGVLAVGIIGAVIARFRPRGMARAMLAASLAQTLICIVALIGGFGLPATGPLELVGLNGFFAGLWLLSAWLFRTAARE